VNGLLRLFGPRRQPVPEVQHPALGTLSYDRESENWGKGAAVLGHQFRFSVGGEHEPHPVLLNRATTLQTELPSVLASLPSFLERAAKDMPELATEIRSLKVEEIAVWWPQQPDAVMIWFSGPSQERSWHCDYSNGVLTSLVFDC